MRRRTKRDFTVLAGILLIITAGIFMNYTFTRTGMAKAKDAMRRQVEAQRESGGLELMKWELLRTTKGGMRTGARFTDDLLAKDEEHIDIVGFMVPLEQFRNVTEFLLLPLPIECYFCQMPPMRDVMLVELADGTKADIYDGPVIINGLLQLNKGPGAKFFYTLKEARIGPGKIGSRLQLKVLDPRHMVPGHRSEVQLQKGFEPPGANEEK